MITIERIALAGIVALLTWVTLTVQSLAVDVAVMKSIQVSGVSQTEFVAFTARATQNYENHQVWLTRLSDRVNTLELKEREMK